VKGLAEIMKHREIEYALKQLGPDKWQWTIHPRTGQGVVRREIKGTREQAEAACKKEIDAGLQRIERNAP
jgi:hypothetical protein